MDELFMEDIMDEEIDDDEFDAGLDKALFNIDNPHVKDATRIGKIMKSCSKRLGTAHAVTAGCYAGCALLLEGADLLLGGLCFAGCSIFGAVTGVVGLSKTADLLDEYTGFRRTWQKFSIPIKDALLAIFPHRI